MAKIVSMRMIHPNPTRPDQCLNIPYVCVVSVVCRQRFCLPAVKRKPCYDESTRDVN